jgi:hypothetical protein
MHVNNDSVHRGRRVKCHLCGQTHIADGEKYVYSWTGGGGYHRFAYSCLRKLVNADRQQLIQFGVEAVR